MQRVWGYTESLEEEIFVEGRGIGGLSAGEYRGFFFLLDTLEWGRGWRLPAAHKKFRFRGGEKEGKLMSVQMRNNAIDKGRENHVEDEAGSERAGDDWKISMTKLTKKVPIKQEASSRPREGKQNLLGETTCWSRCRQPVDVLRVVLWERKLRLSRPIRWRV